MSKRIIATVLSVLMLLTSLTGFVFAAEPATVTVGPNPTTNVAPVIPTDANVYILDTNVNLTEETYDLNWDGKDYILTPGVNVFKTFEDIMAVAQSNGVDTPVVIMISYVSGKDLIVTAPVKIYTRAYNTLPYVMGTAYDCSDWTQNTEFTNNSIKVGNIFISKTVTGGTVELNGITMNGYYSDLFRLADDDGIGVDITFNNLLANQTLTTYDLPNGWVASAESKSTSFVFRMGNASVQAKGSKDSFTIKNAYITKSHSDPRRMMNGVYAPRTTLDGVYCDGANNGFKAAYYVNAPEGGNAEFNIKNSFMSELSWYFEGVSTQVSGKKGDVIVNIENNAIINGFSQFTLYTNCLSEVTMENNILISTSASTAQNAKKVLNLSKHGSRGSSTDYSGVVSIGNNIYNGFKTEVDGSSYSNFVINFTAPNYLVEVYDANVDTSATEGKMITVKDGTSMTGELSYYKDFALENVCAPTGIGSISVGSVTATADKNGVYTAVLEYNGSNEEINVTTHETDSTYVLYLASDANKTPVTYANVTNGEYVTYAIDVFGAGMSKTHTLKIGRKQADWSALESVITVSKTYFNSYDKYCTSTIDALKKAVEDAESLNKVTADQNSINEAKTAIENAIAALSEHVFTNYVSDNNASCTSQGTMTAHCDNGCEGITDTIKDPNSIVSASGHNWTSEFVSDNNATCISDGTRSIWCTNEGCKERITFTDEGTKTRVHIWGEYVSDNNATCVADGTKTAKCISDPNCTATKTIIDEGSKLKEHTWGEYVSDNNATCISDGTKTAKCTVEGCTATHTVIDENTATGVHEFINYELNDDYTCTTDGTETAVCSSDPNCTETHTRTAEGSAAHRWNTFHTTTDDSHWIECSICGEDKPGTIISHTWGEYTYDNNGTVEANGTETAKCVVCSHTHSRECIGTRLDKTLVDTSKTFTDVKSTDWFKEAIDYAVTYGMMNGTSATTMSANSYVTRAQFVQILANIEGVDTTNKNIKTVFTDVKSGEWYAPAVKWASDNGIVTGTTATTFNPHDNLTRENMCLILVRYFDSKNITLKKINEKSSFVDEERMGSWAIDAIYACQQAGLVSGIMDDIFAPKNLATRAQIATIMMRVNRNYTITK